MITILQQAGALFLSDVCIEGFASPQIVGWLFVLHVFPPFFIPHTFSG